LVIPAIPDQWDHKAVRDLPDLPALLDRPDNQVQLDWLVDPDHSAQPDLLVQLVQLVPREDRESKVLREILVQLDRPGLQAFQDQLDLLETQGRLDH